MVWERAELFPLPPKHHALIAHAVLSVLNIKGAGKGCWTHLLCRAQQQQSLKEGQLVPASEAECAKHPDSALPAILTALGDKGILAGAQRGMCGLHLPSVSCIPRLGQGVRSLYCWQRGADGCC